ncbi:uncharacterized protein LOC124280236 [Haliotis rubra]|uniref:uncharacterized protein LOC124280236 n=1 Tax=Haliotis rubra TaxID=36100 RepID=UPI001EE5A075|nr:uncharacterized protein LOC124280236 [Haliotis rubra]
MEGSAVTELSSLLPTVNRFSKEETSHKEQTNDRTVLMKEADSDQSEDTLHAIDATFRIPLLRDPVNHEDPTKRKIDFSVRVGASLARTEDSYVRIIQREFVGTDLSTTSTDTSADNYPRVFQKERRVKVSPRFGITSIRRRRDSRKGSLQILPPKSYITEETCLARFQRIGRAVKIISSICSTLKRHVKENDTRTWSSVEMYLHVQDDLNKKLAFNPLNFTMVAPPRKGERLEHLLQIPPSDRTAKDIKMILAYIRGHASIRDYPSDVQIHMCKHMLYQKYEDRRIVLKQGHPPSAFYFILTGALIVNIEDINPNNGKKFTRTVSELTAGDCFGELALLERSTRTATVICKTTVELLVVLKEDFDVIIRQPLIRQRLSHIRFCQSLVLFEDFPCGVFASAPDDFFYQYIPDDSIVVKDSRECRYLIVVKSGKCSLVAPYKESSQRKEKPLKIREDLERAFPYYAEKRKMNSRPKTGLALERTASDFRDSLEVGLLTGVVDKKQLVERGVEHQRGQVGRRWGGWQVWWTRGSWWNVGWASEGPERPGGWVGEALAGAVDKRQLVERGVEHQRCFRWVRVEAWQVIRDGWWNERVDNRERLRWVEGGGGLAGVVDKRQLVERGVEASEGQVGRRWGGWRVWWAKRAAGGTWGGASERPERQMLVERGVKHQREARWVEGRGGWRRVVDKRQLVERGVEASEGPGGTQKVQGGGLAGVVDKRQLVVERGVGHQRRPVVDMRRQLVERRVAASERPGGCQKVGRVGRCGGQETVGGTWVEASEARWVEGGEELAGVVDKETDGGTWGGAASRGQVGRRSTVRSRFGRRVPRVEQRVGRGQVDRGLGKWAWVGQLAQTTGRQGGINTVSCVLFPLQGGEDEDSTFWAMRLRGPSVRQMMSKRRIGSKSNYRATSAQNMKKLDFLRENTSVSFAQVAELKQGAVFGLESLVHRPNSSLTLVSHGAECLFVSKKFFLQEANIKTLRVVSDMVMTYPSQVFIREHVKVHRDWVKYKRGLVSEVISRYDGS